MSLNYENMKLNITNIKASDAAHGIITERH